MNKSAEKDSRLRCLRKKSGVSAAQVAQTVGIPLATYYRYEKSGSKLPASLLPALCQVLDCRPEDLLEGARPQPEARDTPVQHKDDLEAMFADASLEEVLTALQERQEMRLLFSLAKTATKEDVLRTVRIIEALRREEEGL